MPPDRPWVTFRDAVGGVIALLVIGAICWLALMESQSASTALVGAAGAVTGWLFRGSGQTATNGNGNGNGTTTIPGAPTS
jgi:hypothetical protein